MINWINFLHIYQPPKQNEYIFHQVARESYFEIAKFFDEYDGLKLTMNLSGSLLEQFIAYRYDRLLEDFARAFKSGELELVGSAMYHPILPLLSDAEIERQILADERIKKSVFGASYARHGFYLPEMAYSRRVAELLDRMGFEWIILDEISLTGKLDGLDRNKAYRIKGLRLKAVFRDREISNQFVPEKIRELSERLKGQDSSVVTATDGELYGHRHQDFYNKTKEAFTDSNIRSLQVSEFVARCGENGLDEIDPVTSCWEATEADLACGNPFPYWDDADNVIQQKLGDFGRFAAALVEENCGDENHQVAQGLLDQGVASCHLWAASGKRSAVWKDLIWNPDIIENGNLFFIKAVRSLRELETQKRMEAETRFLEITGLIWEFHWNKFYNS